MGTPAEWFISKIKDLEIRLSDTEATNRRLAKLTSQSNIELKRTRKFVRLHREQQVKAADLKEELRQKIIAYELMETKYFEAKNESLNARSKVDELVSKIGVVKELVENVRVGYINKVLRSEPIGLIDLVDGQFEVDRVFESVNKAKALLNIIHK